jgi:protein MpaA
VIFDELKSGLSTQKEPIKAFKTDISANHYLYLVAGIHGNKVEGICLLDKLYKWMSEDHKLNDLPIILIPIFNVDGYQLSHAKNAVGVDLYTDFLIEPEPAETRFLKKLTKKYPPSKFICFGTAKTPTIEFCKGGKRLANLLSKINFFDLKGLELSEGSLPSYITKDLNSHFIRINFPKFSSEVGLHQLWENNKKHLQELIKSDLLYEAYS